VRYFLRSESATICSLLEIRADGPLAPPHDPRHATPRPYQSRPPNPRHALTEGRGRANSLVVLVNQLWVSSDPIPYKNPQPIGARHQRHWPSLLPLFSGFPSFQKSLADPLFPFPASASQLSKARFSQERICPRHQCSPLSSFPTSNVVQRQVNVSRSSFHFLMVLPSPVSPTKSIAPTTSLCHATTRLSKHWRPRLLQEQLACSKPRKANFASDNFTITIYLRSRHP
jgi:hypothetical protein